MWTLKSQLHGAGKDKSTKMWEEQIKPWFLEVWSKTNRAKDSKVSGALAEMCLNTNESFPDCVDTIINYVSAINKDDHRMIIFRLSDRSEESEQSRIPSAYPEFILKLLHKLFEERPTWHNDYLKGILETIYEVEPKLKNKNEYQDLRKIVGI